MWAEDGEVYQPVADVFVCVAKEPSCLVVNFFTDSRKIGEPASRHVHGELGILFLCFNSAQVQDEGAPRTNSGASGEEISANLLNTTGKM